MSLPRLPVHPIFHGVFHDWLATSGALSAQPDAPVVPDPPARTAKWRALGLLRTRLRLRPRPAGRQEPALRCGTALPDARCGPAG